MKEAAQFATDRGVGWVELKTFGAEPSSTQPTPRSVANWAASFTSARPTPFPRWPERTTTPETSSARSSENREGTRTSP